MIISTENVADLCLFEPSTMFSPQGEHECTPKVTEEPCRELRITADMVGKVVDNLVPSVLDGDSFFVPVFLNTYRSFTTTQHVLDLLLKR